jgi:hypothetical protein
MTRYYYRRFGLSSLSGTILHRPTEIKTNIGTVRDRHHWLHPTGDGFLASFDGPARAPRCAFAIRQDVGALGLESTRVLEKN